MVEPGKDRIAPEGFVWVCGACGKIARGDRYGGDGKEHPRWDESCVLNSTLVEEERLILGEDGRVSHVKEVTKENETTSPNKEGSK